MIEHKQYNYWEHHLKSISKVELLDWERIEDRTFKLDKNKICYKKNVFDELIKIEVGYYIGVDWLVENISSIVVAPKLDSRIEQVIKEKLVDKEIELDDIPLNPSPNNIVTIDYFAMLNQCLSDDYLYKEIDNLVHIDWEKKEVPISQKEDWLSPLLIVKFLNVLKSIVRKGLKKSYYKTVKNLNGKVKGKILIAQNIKQNILKNNLTSTYCQFEEFGIDNIENKLLKKAFQFACSYLENYQKVYEQSNNYFTEIINYCRPAFEVVSSLENVDEIKTHKANPFFKEYTEGIQLAKLLLKRFSYTISNTLKEKLTTPPYWIDMPKLFELYAYHFLKIKFPRLGELEYHTTTYGNELDFLINSTPMQMVVDAKYKPLYIYGKNHQDMRQISGYARLEIVYDLLKRKDDETLLDCLIIYPDMQNGLSKEEFFLSDLKKKNISGYRRIYKVGIKLPVLK